MARQNHVQVLALPVMPSTTSANLGGATGSGRFIAFLMGGTIKGAPSPADKSRQNSHHLSWPFVDKQARISLSAKTKNIPIPFLLTLILWDALHSIQLLATTAPDILIAAKNLVQIITKNQIPRLNINLREWIFQCRAHEFIRKPLSYQKAQFISPPTKKLTPTRQTLIQ